MKRILLSVLFIFILNLAFSQTYPVNQILGSAQTLVISKGGFKADSSFIIPAFNDTSDANRSAYLNKYPGSLIRVGSNMYIRNASATQWIQFVSSVTAIDTSSLSNRINNKIDSLVVSNDSVYALKYKIINGVSSTVKTFQYVKGSGTVTKAVDSVYKKNNGDTIYVRYNSGTTLKLKDSIGVTDTANKYVNAISKNTTQDSIIYFIGAKRYAIRDSSGGTVTKAVDSIWRVAGKDSIFYKLNSGLTYTFKDSVGGGISPFDKTFAFGSFYDSTTQNISSTTTAYRIKISKTDTALGFRIVNNQIVADTNGIFNLQWSGQFQNADNSEQDVNVWIRKNDTDVVGSLGRISVPKTHGGASSPGHIIVSWNYVLVLSKNDSIGFYWQADDTDVSIKYYPMQTSPTRPSTASIIATITPVIAAGTGGGTANAIDSLQIQRDSVYGRKNGIFNFQYRQGQAIFRNNIVLKSGDASNRLGYWKEGDTIKVAGMDLDSAFKLITRKVIPPTYVSPTATVARATGNYSPGAFEIGTYVGNITLSSTFNKNNAGNLISTNYQVSSNNSSWGTFNTKTPVTTNVPVNSNSYNIDTLKSAVYFRANQNYAQGDCLKNSDSVIDCNGRIVAGAVPSSSISYTTYSKFYYGYTATNSTPTDSLIRLTQGGNSSCPHASCEPFANSQYITFTVNCGATPRYIYFAIPAIYSPQPVKLIINGLDAMPAFSPPTYRLVKNASGYSQYYYIYQNKTDPYVGNVTMTTSQ